MRGKFERIVLFVSILRFIDATERCHNLETFQHHGFHETDHMTVYEWDGEG